MMSEESWGQPIHQDELEKQYEALVSHLGSNDTSKDIAMRLARFTEAKMYQKVLVEIKARDAQIIALHNKIIILNETLGITRET